MAHDIDTLMDMEQDALDELFSSVSAGAIPDGEAEGTAIIAPGTRFTPLIARFINGFAWQGKVFDSEKRVLKNQILPFGLNALLITPTHQ